MESSAIHYAAEKTDNSETFCNLCSVYIPNETSWRAHLSGQKHLRNLSKKEEWTKKAHCSLYVSGIKQLPAAELTLADYFCNFSNVKKVTIDKTSKHYAIVELENEESIAKVLENKRHVISGVSVVVKPREIKSSVEHTRTKSTVKEHVFNEDLLKECVNASRVEEQILLIQDRLRLSDEDIHLRGLLCQLIQSALQEAFPGGCIKQFGSSINGFGVRGCDLDLHFEYNSIHPDIHQEILSRKVKDNHESNSGTEDSVEEVSPTDILAVVADIIKQCVPDCHKIKPILNARLPVVRFHHKASKMKCDISLNNHLAVRNTAYLNFCWNLFPSFKPLVFVVRAWMKHWGLAGGVHTNGPRLNNYAVTLMVLFYLQNSGRMLSLERIRCLSKSERTIIMECDCTFPDMSNITGLQIHNAPVNPLEELLADFFTFYAKVEFTKAILDLKTASFIPVSDLQEDVMNCVIKMDTSNSTDADTKDASHAPRDRSFKVGSLNIRDPFDLNHNVAGNVNEKHLIVFSKCIRNAALASKMKKYRTKPFSLDSSWGVLNLFIDHHHKDSNTTERKNDKSLSELKFDIKALNAEDSKWCLKAGGMVLTVLRDVFFIDYNDKDIFSNEEVSKSIEKVKTLTMAIETTPTSNHHQHSPTTGHENQPLKSRKRPASPDSCHFCKRAKIMLSSPTAASLSSSTKMLDQLPLTLACTASHKLWQGRRKARRQLVQKGKSDLLELERQVSKMLLSDLPGSSSMNVAATDEVLNTSTSSTDSKLHASAFNFSLTLHNTSDTVLGLTFVPLTDNSEFLTFFHHLETFLPSFIVKCMKQ